MEGYGIRSVYFIAERKEWMRVHRKEMDAFSKQDSAWAAVLEWDNGGRALKGAV
jgi:hypothetical protein